MDKRALVYLGIIVLFIISLHLAGCATSQVPDMVKIPSIPQHKRIVPASGQILAIFKRIQAVAPNKYGVKSARLYVNMTSTQINAVTWEGNVIVLHMGLLRYTNYNSDELAIVLGHELSHILDGDLVLASREGGPEMEKEADILGINLSIAAGYDCQRGLALWKRYAQDFGDHTFPDHPNPWLRYKYLEAMCLKKS